MLTECLNSLEKEIDNYDKFITNLKKQSMDQIPLPTTPFYFFEEFIKYNQVDVFSSFLESTKSNKVEIKESYLNIAKNVSNAIFLKENSVIQYINFNKSYNDQASEYLKGSYKLNMLYSKISEENLNSLILKNVDDWNESIFQGMKNPNSIQDVKTGLIADIIKTLQQGPSTSIFYSELMEIYKILDVSINKMEEIQNIAADHFLYLKEELIKIKNALTINLNKLV